MLQEFYIKDDHSKPLCQNPKYVLDFMFKEIVAEKLFLAFLPYQFAYYVFNINVALNKPCLLLTEDDNLVLLS